MIRHAFLLAVLMMPAVARAECVREDRDALTRRGYSPAQIEAWRGDLAVPPASLAMRPVCIVEVNALPVGYVQIATDTSPWELWGLWVQPSHMRRGIGKRLLAWAAAHPEYGAESETD